jgi:alpha-1,2-mannosyltransferase
VVNSEPGRSVLLTARRYPLTSLKPLAAVAGVVVWAAWLVSLAPGGWRYDIAGLPVSVDHLAFYSPARMIRQGHEGAIYDHVQLLEYQRSLFPPGRWDKFEAFRNPPFYALLYYPTAGLPYWASAWVWNVVGLACLLLGLHWLLSGDRGQETGDSKDNPLGCRPPVPRPLAPAKAAGWALTFMPVFAAVSYGQNSLLSFAVLCGTYRLLAAGRPFAAGLAAGLLWFKPPLLLGMVVWGLLDLRRLWPAALGVVVTGGVLTLGTYPLLPGAWEGFRQTLAENAGFAAFDWWKMHNPRSFWRLLLPGTGQLATALWLMSAGLGLWGFVQVWRRRDDLPALFGAAVLLTLWTSPHTMIYEWSLAVIPAVLWWNYLPRHRPAWRVLFAVGWVGLFVGTDLGRAQDWLVQRFGIAPPVIVQVSVPLLGWAGWRAVRLLRPAPGVPK